VNRGLLRIPAPKGRHASQPHSRRCHLPNNQIVNDHRRALGEREASASRYPTIRTTPAEQEPRTKISHAPARLFVPDSHPAGDCPTRIGSIQGEAAEYRARSAGRQLGAKILESAIEKPAKTVLLRFFSSATFLLRKLTIRLLSQREKTPKKNPRQHRLHQESPRRAGGISLQVARICG
jgi:hypothetical protein